MDAAFVVTWKSPYPGREKQALEFGAESDEYWGKLAADGKCSVSEWYFTPEGWGIWIVKGERRVLEDIIDEERTAKLLMKGVLLMDGFQYRLADTGRGAERFMTAYAEVGAQLGIIS